MTQQAIIKTPVMFKPPSHESSKPDFSTEILRKDDLLYLKIDFYNFTLDKSKQPANLVRLPKEIAPGTAFMVVTFQGQHLSEQAYVESDRTCGSTAQSSDSPPDLPPVPGILAGPSRIVLIIPDTVQSIPYSIEGLLDWTNYEMNVVPVAEPSPMQLRTPINILTPTNVSLSVQSVAQSKLTISSIAMDVQHVSNTTVSVLTTPKVATNATNIVSGLIIQSAPSIVEPGPTETSIEVPYRLIISPSNLGAWAHSSSSVTHNGWTELWHTRLGVRKTSANNSKSWVDELDDAQRIIRAVWSPDYIAPPGELASSDSDFPYPSVSSLGPFNRHQIVRLTSDFLNIPSLLAAVSVKRLMLSTLGAWMDFRGSWDPPASSGLSLSEWVHQASQGRDKYVRVVNKGYLFPFGHKASVIQISERKFIPSGNSFIAYLMKHYYICVLEHEKQFSSTGTVSCPINPTQPVHNGKDNPFQTINITTQITPNLDQPQHISPLKNTFCPFVCGKPFLFHVVTKDIEGQSQEFPIPLIFVDQSEMNSQNVCNLIELNYVGQGYNIADLKGQKLAFAPNNDPGSMTNNPGKTTFNTGVISFDADLSVTPPPNGPIFCPKLTDAEVDLTVVSMLTNTDSMKMKIEYDDTYKKIGFDPSGNQGEVFAKLVQGAQQVGAIFTADKVGGLITPNMNIVGLSRSLGPIGGPIDSNALSDSLNKIKSGKFDPTTFFKDALSQAKILGIDLISVLAKDSTLNEVPKFINEVIQEAQQVQQQAQSVQIPKQIKASLKWQPKLTDYRIFKSSLTDDKNNILPATMIINVEIIKNISKNNAQNSSQNLDSPPTITVHGELNNFELHLIPDEELIIIKFNKVTFDSKTGQKMSFDASLNAIEFAGKLKFLNSLANLIPLKGFDPPSLEVTPSGINAGYNLAIPSFGLGVFSIQNIEFGASINLPFNGDPFRVRFNFGERQHQCLVSVSLFTGGFFFGIALGPDGVELIEAAIEFGGSASIDIGVASGGVYIMAGIYYQYSNQNGKSSFEVSGFVKCGGSLEVLGLVTVSVEFDLTLNYESASDKFWGQATLTVEISILFFSQSVDLTVQREFGHSPPPTFEDLVPELLDWTEYCEAFS